MTDLATFEQAVGLMFGPHTPERLQAEKWIETNISLDMFESFFFQTGSLQTRYYCVMQFDLSIPKMTADDRVNRVVPFIHRVIVDKTQSSGAQITHTNLEKSILNKLASIYSKCIVRDYLTSWNTAFSSLVHAIQNADPKDKVSVFSFLLRVLQELHEELFSADWSDDSRNQERQVVSNIKDQMKAVEIDSLLDMFCGMLEHCSNDTGGGLSDLQPETLTIIRGFISWVEVHKVWSERLVNLLYRTLLNNRSNVEVFSAACDVFVELLERKMPSRIQKLKAFVQFGVLDFFVDRLEEPTNGAKLEKKAEVIDSIAEEVFKAFLEARTNQGKALAAAAKQNRQVTPGVDNTSLECTPPGRRTKGVLQSPAVTDEPSEDEILALQLLNRLLPRISAYFAHPAYEVANSVEEFLSLFFKELETFCRPIGRVKKNTNPSFEGKKNANFSFTEGGSSGSGSPAGAAPALGIHPAGGIQNSLLVQIQPFTREILSSLTMRMAYPPWYSLDDTELDERDHQNFQEYQRDLESMFKHIFRLDEDLVLQWMQSEINNISKYLPANGVFVRKGKGAGNGSIAINNTVGPSVNADRFYRSHVDPDYSHEEAQIVAMLRWFLIIGSASKTLDSNLKADDHQLTVCLTSLLNNQVLLKCDSWQIQLELFDICNKYRTRFEGGNVIAQLQTALELYIRAILSPNMRVCKRACFCFNLFVKRLRSSICGVAKELVLALNQCMFIPYIHVPQSNAVASNSTTTPGSSPNQENPPTPGAEATQNTTHHQENVFEAMGVIASTVQSDLTKPFLAQLLENVAGQLQELASSDTHEKLLEAIRKRAGADVLVDHGSIALYASRILSCLAAFCKSFHSKMHRHVASEFEQIFVLAEQVHERLKSSPAVRQSFRLLCRIMIKVLGTEFLTALRQIFPRLFMASTVVAGQALTQHDATGAFTLDDTVFEGKNTSALSALIITSFSAVDLKELLVFSHHITAQFESEHASNFWKIHFDLVIVVALRWLYSGTTAGDEFEHRELIETTLDYLRELSMRCTDVICTYIKEKPQISKFMTEILDNLTHERHALQIAEIYARIITHCSRPTVPNSPTLQGLPLPSVVPKLLKVIAQAVKSNQNSKNNSDQTLKLVGEVACILRELCKQHHVEVINLVTDGLRDSMTNQVACENLMRALKEGGYSLNDLKQGLKDCC